MSRPGPSSPLSQLSRVRVGTRNPAKLEAVRRALAPFAPDARVEGADVESGVPEQPVGLEETVLGARNRARAAAGDAELGVGLEDGLVRLPGVDGIWNVGAAVVVREGAESVGLSAGFAYPPRCSTEAVAGPRPVGELFDRAWERHRGASPDEGPSGTAEGNVGRLTLGVLTRAEYASHAVLCALVRLLHPDLYAADAAGDAS